MTADTGDAKADAAVDDVARLSPAKRRVFGIVLVLLVLCVVACVGECSLRALGHRPWTPVSATDQRIQPGGTLFEPNDTLAYVLLPGEFVITQRLVTWRATHLPSRHRRTGPAPKEGAAESLWIFGDSYTYGWGVNDDETYAWRLQTMMPDVEVVNHGVGGYSTLQALLAFEAALAQAEVPPKVVVLGYASFHDGRNAMLRANRKGHIPYVSRFPKFPAAWIDDGVLKYGSIDLEYQPFPLQRHSALVNFIEERYNKLQVLTSGAGNVSRALIQKFAKRCSEANITFVLAGVHQNARTKAMLDWARDSGITAVDISVDQTLEVNVVPGDGHPSGKAHEAFATRLFEVLAPLYAGSKAAR